MDGGFKSFLNVVSSLVGIVVGILTIVFYFTDADSLLAALGGLLPWANAWFLRVDAAVREFSQQWAWGPLATALALFALIFVARWLAEVAFDLLTVEVTAGGVALQMLVFLPAALLWVWLFSGVVGPWWMAGFVLGYVATIALSIFVAAEVG